MTPLSYRIWSADFYPGEAKFIYSGSTPMMLSGFFRDTARIHTICQMPYEQFTGLHDAKNVAIFEGDIVRVKCAHGYKEGKKITGLVVYNEDHVHFEVRYDIQERSHGVEYLDQFYQVIGNVHENPELLEMR
ncbi:MAG: YopX family protein [Actinobacteria bacterium]|nr:YopX family protein [Actinomycetota bacterium]